MKNVAKQLVFLPLLALAVACPGDKKNGSAQIPVDSTKQVATTDTATMDTTKSTDLGAYKANLPKPAPDTFHRQHLTPSGNEAAGAHASYPDAPSPLLDAVEREQSATRFCYTEFGQKADPTLRGNVAMVVTIGNGGVNDARVGDSKWTGSAGRAVNRCLDQKAKEAWNVAPGAVKPGRYVVQLSFSGTR